MSRRQATRPALRILICFIVAMMTVSVSPALKTTGEENYATVDFNLKICSLVATHPFSKGIFTYQVSGDSNSTDIVKSLSWNSHDMRPLRFSLQLPAGLYDYDIRARNADASIGCQANYYFAVLPRDTQHINDAMFDCCAEALPALFVIGIAPRTVGVSIIRFDGALDCGSPLPAPGSWLSVKQDTIGFYASDDHLTGRSNNRNVVFGIQIRDDSGEKRTVRVLADYPANVGQVEPKLVRFDLTPQLMDALFKGPPGTLSCLK
jgi:hypothetical protein